jgi:trans-aconitate methyltransferase
MSPLCESYLRADQLNAMEPFYPLHVWVCEACLLVQLEQYVTADDIFTEYAYFSSYSDSWVAHAHRYTEDMIERFSLDHTSFVIEVASNDGYLLQHFVQRDVPVLGIEPAANVAVAAEERGVPTRVEFFGMDLARSLVSEGTRADLVVGNNVLAQVPDVNDFVAGLAHILSDGGVLTLEFPHLARLVAGRQFDTIYHEHFSYFSLLATEAILGAHGLTVFDVEELATHGGSLRVFAGHAGRVDVGERVLALREVEKDDGYHTLDRYLTFADDVQKIKHDLLSLLIATKAAGSSIAGYGAPGKGNTLLNYCGIRTDFVDYTVDRNPYKQGMFLPGSHIPIHAPEMLDRTRPDHIFVLPWNLRDEILTQLAYAREWGARFIIPIPTPEVVG